jgi:general L-amino acid transport system permease protein
MSRPPPRSRAAASATWRRALFAGPASTLLTLVFVALSAWAAWRLLDWGVLAATWTASDRQGCAPGGACWAFVAARLPQFLFGFYPPALHWRPALAMALPLLPVLLGAAAPGRHRAAACGAAILATPTVMLLLVAGGVPGLAPVTSDRWGGLSLTILIATTAFVASLPLALALAYARRAPLPVVSGLAAGFIELWRGLPLVTVLFMAVILLPLFLPAGSRPDRFATAVVALTLYNSAYLAEVLRGGLQAVARSQGMAARALGFGFWRTQVDIVLPQALRVALPAIVNVAVALLKDTSYVMVVGLFDFIGIVAAALSDPRWMGPPTEAYLFIGAVYWLACFGLSRWAGGIERRLAT